MSSRNIITANTQFARGSFLNAEDVSALIIKFLAKDDNTYIYSALAGLFKLADEKMADATNMSRQQSKFVENASALKKEQAVDFVDMMGEERVALVLANIMYALEAIVGRGVQDGQVSVAARKAYRSVYFYVVQVCFCLDNMCVFE